MQKILIYNSGGGLGDTIRIFPLIISLKKHFTNTKLFYLSAHENHFIGKLKEFNIFIESLSLNIKYFGFRFWHLFFVKYQFEKTGMGQFDLIIDLQSKLRNTLILKQISHKLFYSSALNFRLCTVKKNYKKDFDLENLNSFLNTNILEREYNLSNIKNIFFEEAQRLLPSNNYVGLSITQGNVYRKKSWSLDKFINLSKDLIKIGKKPVFFINEDEKLIDYIQKKVPESLFPELKSNLRCPALVTALSSRLDLAVSIDNGIMHMMSLAKIPMIVLFGPTNSNKFAPKYDSIKILDSKVLYESKDINLISVDDVLSII